MNGERTVAVDIGNSAIKLAWLRGDQLLKYRFPLKNPDWPRELAAIVREQASSLADSAVSLADARNWFVASVNRPATARLQKLVASEFSSDHWLELTRADIDLATDIRNPESVGIDRLLGAQAAMRISGSSSVISIDAGSAVTVDLVHDGVFVGGAILPGIQLQFSVLCQATDRLPSVAGDDVQPLEIPGKDTISAIRSGVLQGIAGAIDRLVSLYSKPFGNVPPIIFTGGDAAALQPLLQQASERHDGLVLLAILQRAAPTMVWPNSCEQPEPQRVSFD